MIFVHKKVFVRFKFKVYSLYRLIHVQNVTHVYRFYVGPSTRSSNHLLHTDNIQTPALVHTNAELHNFVKTYVS